MMSWSRMRLVRSLRAWLSVSVILVFAAGFVALWDSRGITLMMTNFLIVSTLVLAIQVFVGNSGILSFGHVGFFGMAAYVTAILTIPPEIKVDALPDLLPGLKNAEFECLPAVIVAGTATGLFALVTGIVFARMKEIAMLMATLALLVMIHSVLLNWNEVTRGTFGIYGIPQNVTLLSALTGALVVMGLAFLFKASPIGISLQATREDLLAAQSLGIDVVRVRLIGWVISAALMGAGGSLWAQSNLAFSPAQFSFLQTFSLLSMLVIGGTGSVTGAICGTAIVTAVGEILRNFEHGFRLAFISVPKLPGLVQLAVALMIMIVLIFRPTGVLGLREFDLFSLVREKMRKAWKIDR